MYKKKQFNGNPSSSPGRFTVILMQTQGIKVIIKNPTNKRFAILGGGGFSIRLGKISVVCHIIQKENVHLFSYLFILNSLNNIF